MTLTVGRCVLPDPSNVDASGDFLSLSGVFYSTATTAANRAAEAQARSAQLMGMVDNPDEDVFRLVWSSESMYDGFYAVEDASWSWLNDGSSRAAVAAWSLTLRRVSDFGQPKAEIQYLGTLRTNVHGLSPTGQLGRRFDLEAWDVSDQPFAPSVRESDDGVTFYQFSVSDQESGVASFEPEPSAHHDGGASVEVLGADAAWYPWTGRQMGRVDPSDVRLTNHLCRFSISDGGVMTHAVYSPAAAAWESTTFTLAMTPFASSFLTFDTCTAPTILRNDIDTVVVRYNMRSSSNYASYGSIFATVTLRAGDLFATVHLTSTQSQPKYGVAASSSTAATSITGGLRRTSNDANGNRWVISTPHTFTGDTTNGSVQVDYTATSTPTFMIGQALDGSSANANNAETALVDQFMLSVYSKTRIVAR